jgi:hypothetical protein
LIDDGIAFLSNLLCWYHVFLLLFLSAALPFEEQCGLVKANANCDDDEIL